MTEGKLRGDVVVVSGVSRGLGAAIAEDFLRRGAKVAGFSRQSSDTVDRMSQATYADSFLFSKADMVNRDSL